MKSLDVAKYASTYNLYLCVEMHIVGTYNLCNLQGSSSTQEGHTLGPQAQEL